MRDANLIYSAGALPSGRWSGDDAFGAHGRCSTMLARALLTAGAAMGVWAAPAPAASVTLTPARIQPGGTVVLAGRGFPARRAGEVTLRSTFSRALRANSRGEIRRSVTVARRMPLGPAGMVVRVGGRRVALPLRVVGVPESTPSAIVASSSGENVFVTPTLVSAGRNLHLVGSRFTPRAAVSVLARGRLLARVRASRTGRFTLAVPMGLQIGGTRSVEVRSGRLRLVIPVAVSPAPVDPLPAPLEPAPPFEPAPAPGPAPAPDPPPPPPPPPPRSPILAAAGDIACDPNDPNFNGGNGIDLQDGNGPRCFQKATAQVLQGVAPDAVAALGDEQYETASLAQFNLSFNPSWGQLKPALRPVPGNHEYYDPDPSRPANGYFTYFGAQAGDPAKGYYSYDLGAWHIVALNSNCGRIGGCGLNSPEQTWLAADLRDHPAACVLAYWHHPLFSSRASAEEPQMAPIWQTLYDAGADVVLSGHAHSYERFAPQSASGEADGPRGIREFVVGSGGEELIPFYGSRKLNSQMQNETSFGVLSLRLDPTGYAWDFRSTAGGTFSDTATGQCH